MKELSGILAILLPVLMGISCADNKDGRDYRKDMRDFVENISIYSRFFYSDFLVIPQNGVEIITLNGRADGPIAESYISRINGVAQEDLFFGYNADNVLTPVSERNYLIGFLDRVKTQDKIVWVIDYCSSPANVDSAYQWNFRKNYVSFAAPSRELDVIPAYPANPFRFDSASVKNIRSAKNLLFLINSELYPAKSVYLDALDACKYDALVIDLFYKDTALTTADLNRIRYKPSPSVPRIVLCYMSVGEAENYRYYWRPEWNTSPPGWLADENPDWPGNYKVRYWHKEWQNIIYGNNQSYVKKIMEAGFDGVYLDIIDAFEYFE